MIGQLTKTLKDNFVGIASIIVGLFALILDHIVLMSALVSEIWQRLFVNIWFVWLAIGAYGVGWLVRFHMNLRDLAKESQDRLTAMENELRATQDELINRLDKEAKSRIACDKEVEKRVDAHDSKSHKDVETLREDTRAVIAQVQHEVASLSKEVSHLKETLQQTERPHAKDLARGNRPG